MVDAMFDDTASHFLNNTAAHGMYPAPWQAVCHEKEVEATPEVGAVPGIRPLHLRRLLCSVHAPGEVGLVASTNVRQLGAFRRDQLPTGCGSLQEIRRREKSAPQAARGRMLRPGILSKFLS